MFASGKRRSALEWQVEADSGRRYRLVASREPDAARPAPIRAEVIRFDPAAQTSFPPLIAGRLGLMRAAEAAGRVVVLEAAE